MKIKFTNRELERLPAPDPSGRERLYWDQDCKGFGLYVSGRSTVKTFVVQHDLHQAPDKRKEGAKPKPYATRRIRLAPYVKGVDLDEMRQKAHKMLSQMYDGIDPREQRRVKHATSDTLQQTLDAYLKARSKSDKPLRPATINDYRSTIERYLSDWLDKPLRSITPQMVRDRHSDIQEGVVKGKYANGHSASSLTKGNHSANATMRVLRLLWNYAVDADPSLPANPVRSLRKHWFEEERRQTIIEPEQLPAFYRAVLKLENTMHRDYLLLCLFTGLRRSTAAGLLRSEVKLDERVIEFGTHRMKGKRPFRLPMSDYVYDLLKARMDVGKEGPFVFPARSKSGHISEPRAALDDVADMTGIHACTNDLRRVFTTTAESLDLSPYTIKRLVHHKLPKDDVTAGYIKQAEGRLRIAAQQVADEIKKLCGTAKPDKNVVKLVGRKKAA